MTRESRREESPLTRRQQQVCTLVAQGMTSKQIGAQLGIGHRTVEDCRAVVFKKFGVSNAIELVRKVFAE